MPHPADDSGLVAAAVQRQFDVIVPATIGGKPQSPTGRRNRERISFRFQRVCQHARGRRGDLFEKCGVGTFSFSDVLPLLLRARLRAIDRMLELPSDFLDFHVCSAKLIVESDMAPSATVTIDYI